jgi:ribonuclease VapC
VTVVDASAVLAFVQGEPGADVVEDALTGAVCGAANWSEVAQKVLAGGRDWDLVRALLASYELLAATLFGDGSASFCGDGSALVGGDVSLG